MSKKRKFVKVCIDKHTEVAIPLEEILEVKIEDCEPYPNNITVVKKDGEELHEKVRDICSPEELLQARLFKV